MSNTTLTGKVRLLKCKRAKKRKSQNLNLNDGLITELGKHFLTMNNDQKQFKDKDIRQRTFTAIVKKSRLVKRKSPKTETVAAIQSFFDVFSVLRPISNIEI